MNYIGNGIGEWLSEWLNIYIVFHDLKAINARKRIIYI